MGGFNTGLNSGPNGASGSDAENYHADMQLLGEEAPATDEGESGDEDAGLTDGEGDEELPEGEGSEEETPEGEEEKPEGEEEEEGEEKPEDKADDKTTRLPYPRPTVSEIKAAYPDFFKKFPDMRHMLFREAEFTNIFPTVDDAKEAAEQSQSFGHFSNLLSTGNKENIGQFLKGVHEAGPEMLESFAGNFLPALYEQNRDLYFATTTPVAQSLLQNAYKAGSQGNENLKNAALHIAAWALGDAKYATGELRVAGPKTVEAKTDPKFEQEKQQFYNERYTETQQFVGKTADTRLRNEVRKGLDPNSVFNDFTTSLLVDKIMAEVGQQLEKDPKHMGTMNSLWKHARQAGFAGNFKDRILSAYLSGARAIMPAVRARIRDAALKDQKTRLADKGKLAGKSGDRREVPGSRTTAPNLKGRTPSAREVNWNQTSDMDILNDKFTLKNGR